MKLRERLIKILSEGVKEPPKQLTLSESDLNDLVEKRANELLEQELSSLDKAFLKEVSDKINSVEVQHEQKTLSPQNKEAQVKDILNNKE